MKTSPPGAHLTIKLPVGEPNISCRQQRANENNYNFRWDS